MKTLVSTMTTDTQAPQRVIAWTFQRGGQFLTCEVLCTSDKRYAVLVIPHGPAGTALVEQQANSVDALQRHAALAMQLRQQGWSVATYAPLPSPRTPAPQAYPQAA